MLQDCNAAALQFSGEGIRHSDVLQSGCSWLCDLRLFTQTTLPAAGCCVHVGYCVPLPSVAPRVEIMQNIGANRCHGEANHCHLRTIVQLAVYRRRYE